MTVRARAAKLVVAPLLVLLSGCVTVFAPPEKISGGGLDGKTLLEWDDGYRFVFRPKQGQALVYTFPVSHPLAKRLGSITPRSMYTDGGSIPRIFWSVDGLSPWEYGPAFVIHDWIFNRHYCAPNELGLTMGEANAILYDALNIVDAKRKKDNSRGPADPARTRALIQTAVDAFSKTVWDGGKCPGEPPSEFVTKIVNERVLQTVIRAGRSVKTMVLVPQQRTLRRFRILREISAN